MSSKDPAQSGSTKPTGVRRPRRLRPAQQEASIPDDDFPLRPLAPRPPPVVVRRLPDTPNKYRITNQTRDHNGIYVYELALRAQQGDQREEPSKSPTMRKARTSIATNGERPRRVDMMRQAENVIQVRIEDVDQWVSLFEIERFESERFMAERAITASSQHFRHRRVAVKPGTRDYGLNAVDTSSDDSEDTSSSEESADEAETSGDVVSGYHNHVVLPARLTIGRGPTSLVDLRRYTESTASAIHSQVRRNPGEQRLCTNVVVDTHSTGSEADNEIAQSHPERKRKRKEVRQDAIQFLDARAIKKRSIPNSSDGDESSESIVAPSPVKHRDSTTTATETNEEDPLTHVIEEASDAPGSVEKARKIQIQRILSHSVIGRETSYLVTETGRNDGDAVWVYSDELSGSTDILTEYLDAVDTDDCL